MKTSWSVFFLVALSSPKLSFGEHIRGSKRALQLEIVGGDETTFAEHPYYVELQDFGLICGASLIWEDIVLTAAHCNGAGISTARVGPNQQAVGIEKGTEHPDYNSNTLNWDFMVLKLENSALSTGATTIGLESNDGTLSEGEDLVVVGLGATSEGGAGSSLLQEVTVQYIPNSECNVPYNGGITDAMLCAGVDGGGKDSCQGDSGGPIFQGSTQVGVVSWGIGCARPEYPGVYARVSAAYDWIQDMICCHSANPPSTCGTVDPSECPNTFSGGDGGPSTPAPTPGPVDCDAGETLFRLEILTDGFPDEISWELTNDCTSDVVVTGGGNYLPSTRYVEQQCLEDGQQYTFIINDSYGDGICCDYGQGEYSLDYGPNGLHTGGEYGGSETTTFGTCVASPTGSPTTSSPTNFPSSSPTGCSELMADSASTVEVTIDGGISGITYAQLIETFKESVEAVLPVEPCSPVIEYVTIARQTSQRASQSVVFTVFSTKLNGSSLIADDAADQSDFLIAFSTGLGLAPTAASSVVSEDATMPCCVGMSWGDYLTRKRCPNGETCFCPDFNCCTVCMGTFNN